MNIPEVKSSYEYVTELRERLEDSLKLAQEELVMSQKRYKRHYDRKAKPRRLEVGDRVLILLPTVRTKGYSTSSSRPNSGGIKEI